MVLHGKSSRECSANAGDLQGFILGPALFLMQINNLLDMLSVILLSMLMMLLLI